MYLLFKVLFSILKEVIVVRKLAKHKGEIQRFYSPAAYVQKMSVKA